ncbi:hypothetical protein [Niallia taxi]|uniref:Uncharacterized protein n=1 Tax=Niallia taxi TaxID=2499688 RepID=A0A437K2W1_9BACI|nr:hypothetical protein [Niallia taxi]RVT56439.1 hypothetical protein EM808_27510 [Niallia taxi]
MKTFRVKKDKQEVILEYDDDTSRYDAMLVLINEFGRYLQDHGKGEELQYYLEELACRYESEKELEELNKTN